MKIIFPAQPTKRVQLTAIPVSKNWQFGKEDIDELLFMLEVRMYSRTAVHIQQFVGRCP